MASDTKMLQLVLDKVSSIDKKVDKGFRGVDVRFNETNKRIDKLGLQVASLEDDAPTIKEFDNLDNRVKRVEKQVASV